MNLESKHAQPEHIRPAFHPFLPYGRQVVEEDDIEAVAEVLRSDFLTTGPLASRFEHALAATVGSKNAVVCSSGTAALYMAARALELGPGKTVIVPSVTFAATASGPRLAGANVVLSDVDPATGLMRAEDLEEALSRAPSGRADAVFPVHYAGQCCDMKSIAALARARGMRIVEDAAHALGSALVEEGGALTPAGANLRCDLTIFSFHPVKTVAMGEGGAVSANDPELLRRLRAARNHGITRSPGEFVFSAHAFDSSGVTNPWYYEVEDPGFNFRVSDINCALGLSQLKKLARFVEHRRQLVACYVELLRPFAPAIRPLAREKHSHTAWHIYPVRIDFASLKCERGPLMRALAAEGIGTQVHYIPLHMQPAYTVEGLKLRGAESYYAATLSLPLHVGMSASDAERAVRSLTRNLGL